MNCELWETKLDGYVDGELGPQDEGALRSHLKACPACSQEALGRMELKRAIRAVGKRYRASDDFRTRTWAQVSDLRQAGRRPAPTAGTGSWAWIRNWRPMVAAAALVLLIFIATFFYAQQRMHRRQIIAEVIDLHVSNLAGANPVDVVSSDKHTVKPWFQGKLPFTFDLPDLAGTQFELLGGKVAYVNQEPAALLVYGIRKHKVSVIISLDRAGLEELGPTAATVNAFHLETWSQRGLRYLVISDTSAQDVHTLAGLLRESSIAR